MLVLCQASILPSALEGQASGVCFSACHGKMHKVRVLIKSTGKVQTTAHQETCVKWTLLCRKMIKRRFKVFHTHQNFPNYCGIRSHVAQADVRAGVLSHAHLFDVQCSPTLPTINTSV